MTSRSDTLKPEIEFDLPAVYNAGAVAARHAAEVSRLKALLTLTTFLLESAADEALSAHREVEKLTYELVTTRWAL